MNLSVVATAASIVVLGVVALAEPAAAKDGPEVRIRNAAARVVVIVEDRADVGVEIDSGSTKLPHPTVTRVGDNVRIDGELGRNAIRSCHGGSNVPARNPGEGVSVDVRDVGQVDLSAAPMIVLRTPRHVDVTVEGSSAVAGAVGRGATSVSLGNSGCGDWTVANVSGALEVSTAGSGDVWAGTAETVEVSVAGSGGVTTGAARRLEASIAGSGAVTSGAIAGPVEASIAGSGNVRVRGDAGPVDASIAGSGNVNIDGAAASIDASLIGSGGVSAHSVAGSVSQNRIGSGRVRVGG